MHQLYSLTRNIVSDVGDKVLASASCLTVMAEVHSVVISQMFYRDSVVSMYPVDDEFNTVLCDHCHSLVDFALSGCGKSWSETTEEGFTFQCLGCWKVDCLRAELAKLTDLVKGMERGGRMIARKTNGERTTENMPCMKETVEKVTVEKEGGGGQGDRR